METILCSDCKSEKLLDEFYDHPATASGKLGRCKECHKSRVRANRAKNRVYYARYDKSRNQTEARKSRKLEYDRRRPIEKKRAANAVHNALRDGRIFRKPCEVCGSEKSEAHHADYSKPLDVQWLCFKHHREVHGQVVISE